MAFTSNTANFGSGDLATEQAQLQRQQALAQALAQQSQTPLQAQPTPAGGLAVPIGKGEIWSKLGQALASAYVTKATGDKEKEFNANKQAKISEALGNFDKLRSGAPEQQVDVFGTSPNQPTQETMPAVAANPRAASLSLLNSGVPELQQFGMQAFLKDNSSKFSTTPQYDQSGNAYVLDEQGNMKYLNGIKGREKLLNVDGQLVGEYTGNKQGEPIPKRANRATDLLYQDDNGNWIPNTALAELKKQIAEKGAPKVDVKTNVKMGESLGAQIGPIVKESSEQATAASNQVQIAQQLRNTLDSNKLYTGTGANTKLQLAQIGDTFGITGKDTQEKIANTRQAVQNLAQLTLEGRKQMRGQGQITDQESALAQRAMSGDVTLTPTELRVLANSAERAGRAVYANHQRKLDALSSDPNVQQLAPYYQAQPLPEAQQATQAAPQQQVPAQQPRRLVYDPATGGFR